MPSLTLPMSLPMVAVGDPEVFHDFKVGQFPVNGTFSRASTVNGWTLDANGDPVLYTFAIDEPAFVIDPATGQSLGYRALEGATNKCQNFNLNPDASLTNISASAGTLERVDDSANLPLSSQFDGNAFHLNNATGGSVTITVTGQCGNTNAHSIGVLCRFTGTAPTVQLTGGDGAAACNNDYDETKSEGIPPSATTDQWQLVVPDGTEVWFVANQLEEGAFISSWIETEGSPVSTAADDATEPLPASCQDGFVWVVHGRTPKGSSGIEWIGSIEGDNTNLIRAFRRDTGSIEVQVYEDASLLLSLSLGSVPANTDFKLAVRAEAGNYAGVLDGGSLDTDTNANFPNGLHTKQIGQRTSGNNWNSTIAHEELHPDTENWSDARLQAETS